MDRIEAFDEFLNENYAWPEIMGIQFAPSDILWNVDPIAYRCYGLDYLDAIGEDKEE